MNQTLWWKGGKTEEEQSHHLNHKNNQIQLKGFMHIPFLVAITIESSFYGQSIIMEKNTNKYIF